MSKVAIVTDSTAYIPTELSRGYPIFSVPLHVIWGDRTYYDNVDIFPSDFYQRLEHAQVMPTTSQPSPAAFKDLYDTLLAQDYEILSVHISSRLSGTVDSATQAKAMLPSAPIVVVDSLLTSMAMGFPILKAARAASLGATLADCQTIVQNALPKVGVKFVVSTLEFLKRGGRIGGAAAFVGNAFNIKPILDLKDGRIEAVEKVRTMNKALERMIALTFDEIHGQSPVSLAVIHSNAPEEAKSLLAEVRGRLGVNEVNDAVIAELSPVIGTHAGPGTLGLAYMVGM